MRRSGSPARALLVLVLVGIAGLQGLDLGIACQLHCPMHEPHRCCEPLSPEPSPCCSMSTHPPSPELVPSHGPTLAPPVAVGLSEVPACLAFAPPAPAGDEPAPASTSPPVAAVLSLRI